MFELKEPEENGNLGAQPTPDALSPKRDKQISEAYMIET